MTEIDHPLDYKDEFPSEIKEENYSLTFSKVSKTFIHQIWPHANKFENLSKYIKSES